MPAVSACPHGGNVGADPSLPNGSAVVRGLRSYIGKTRRVIHLKNVVIADPRWTFIPKSDPKNVGAVYEIRLEGTVADVRAAFNAGFATLVATP